MPYGLSDTQINLITGILSENTGLRKVILYGSRAKGNFNSGSDIDLALSGDGLDLKDIVSLKARMDDLPILNKIDLVLYEQINEPALTEHIDRVGIVLYQKAI